MEGSCVRSMGTGEVVPWMDIKVVVRGKGAVSGCDGGAAWPNRLSVETISLERSPRGGAAALRSITKLKSRRASHVSVKAAGIEIFRGAKSAICVMDVRVG